MTERRSKKSSIEPEVNSRSKGERSSSGGSYSFFSRNESKKSAEKFFLLWSFLWISFFGGVVVTGVYKEWNDIGYLCCGLVLTVPNLLLPNLFPSEADKKLPWTRRFVTKSYLWIFFLNFTGNYFWTHYFFVLLGASYSFPVTWKLNEIPIALYMITQSYFTTYFLLSNLALRQVYQLFKGKKRIFALVLVVIALSWFLAFMETWTIQSVPYYSFVDPGQMYRVGLTFYALYFIPSFPMFFFLDEEINQNCTLWEAALSGLSASMLAFYLVDFWRLMIGNIHNNTNGPSALPFVK